MLQNPDVVHVMKRDLARSRPDSVVRRIPIAIGTAVAPTEGFGESLSADERILVVQMTGPETGQRHGCDGIGHDGFVAGRI